jgi:hypothetical protein
VEALEALQKHILADYQSHKVQLQLFLYLKNSIRWMIHILFLGNQPAAWLYDFWNAILQEISWKMYNGNAHMGKWLTANVL